MLFFVCSEAAESKLVKLDTSRTVILPPTVGVIWPHYFSSKILHITWVYQQR